ncbi:tRNA (adenosine(37)-N6)-threonylcarbamoyltransferase complex ATPase subunit type 1 TsaE [Thioalkalivibrio sp. XN279]|uniref:tRNA (adenosine(37)-N6)-threonylcarbamoyltransferase complex ATPase subunit type 1 TsaE n=1 Tax=Thioalkalivibrio sp. XN279 TaxID=2714953 RepID=UPI00351B74B7
MLRIHLPDAAATEALGSRLAARLADACRQAPLVVHLEGPLGAGKTTLVRGLLRGLGHTGRVRSPTFTLLEPYELPRCEVAHLDLYRLADPAELDYLGLPDMLHPGALVLVEWAGKGGDRLPGADIRVALEYEGEGRCARCEAGSSRGEPVLAALEPAPAAPVPPKNHP